MHKSKNVAPYIKAQHLNQALNECLPKIIQIFDCTVNKLVLKMDRNAAERSAEKFRAQQSNNNNNDAVVLRLPSKPLCGDVLCGGEDFCWFCVCGPFFSLTAARQERKIRLNTEEQQKI